MLSELLTSNRRLLIDRCRAKAALRLPQNVSQADIEYGIPVFIDQLIKTLVVEKNLGTTQSAQVSGPSGGEGSGRSEIGVSATQHGRELLQQGFTVDQVVHDYGDLCQAVTELASEVGTLIDVNEFRILNRCMDNATADAVTEFSCQHESVTSGKHAHAGDERLRALANEQRSHIRTATLAMAAIRAGNVGLKGATGAILDHSLVSLQKLIDRFLAGVRITSELPDRHQVISMAHLIAEVGVPAQLEAQNRNCKFTVREIDRGIAVVADRDMLFTAVGNLLQNAFKFSVQNSEITLNAFAAGPRVLVEIGDSCGGLPSSAAGKMFLPPLSDDSSNEKLGLGLGLAICQSNVEAIKGTLSVRDVPGSGYFLTISLSRHLMH